MLVLLLRQIDNDRVLRKFVSTIVLLGHLIKVAVVVIRNDSGFGVTRPRYNDLSAVIRGVG